MTAHFFISFQCHTKLISAYMSMFFLQPKNHVLMFFVVTCDVKTSDFQSEKAAAQSSVIKSQCTTERLSCPSPAPALAILCPRREYDLVPLNCTVHSLICFCSCIALRTMMQLNKPTRAKTCLQPHPTSSFSFLYQLTSNACCHVSFISPYL